MIGEHEAAREASVEAARLAVPTDDAGALESPPGDDAGAPESPPGDDAGAPESPPADLGADVPLIEEPGGWEDPLTGCDGPRLWDRVVSSEHARNARYKRTATIALIEFAGIDAAAERWGRELATQLFVRLAKVLAGGIRTSDHIARIGRTRFAVLLVETDQILAINFADRIRARCTAAIDPELHGIRMAIGWASPAVRGDLADAQVMAAERLEADLARQTPKG